MVTAAPLLEVRKVTVRFGGVVAVRELDLSIPAGQVRGVIGPNGAGKTTLFDSITGVNTPSSGKILMEGQDITGRSAMWRARRGIRRTFQRQQPFGWLSVEDNVLAALEWEGGGGGMLADVVGLPTRRRREAERREKVEAALELCQLTDIRTQAAGKLSIGRARMVELARAVVADPKVLLLDEPTSGLDHQEADTLGEIVQSIRSNGQTSVLLVEHDVRFVMEQCDRIVVLNLGQVIGEGEPAEVAADQVVRDAYLG